MVRPALNHVGVMARDLDALATFYKEAVGMLETDRGMSSAGTPVIFLSSDPSIHHQLVLAAGRGSDQASTIGQLSFVLPEISDLRTTVARLRAAGREPQRIVDHGASWSVYVLDPEDNTLEFYVVSPWYIPQPHADPLDLDLPDEKIRRITLERCRATPGFKDMSVWSQGMTARLGEPP